MEFVLFFAVIIGIYRIVTKKDFSVGKIEKFCTACGDERKPKLIEKGSGAVEVILWLLFILPGLVYTIWRANSKHETCWQCGSTALIPPSSPAAIAAKKMMGGEN